MAKPKAGVSKREDIACSCADGPRSFDLRVSAFPTQGTARLMPGSPENSLLLLDHSARVKQQDLKLKKVAGEDNSTSSSGAGSDKGSEEIRGSSLGERTRDWNEAGTASAAQDPKQRPIDCNWMASSAWPARLTPSLSALSEVRPEICKSRHRGKERACIFAEKARLGQVTCRTQSLGSRRTDQYGEGPTNDSFFAHSQLLNRLWTLSLA